MSDCIRAVTWKKEEPSGRQKMLSARFKKDKSINFPRRKKMKAFVKMKQHLFVPVQVDAQSIVLYA